MTVNFPGDVLRDVNEKLLIASVEQHEAAEIARQAEGRLADLINGLDAVICEVNVATGDIIFLSDQANSFLGYKQSAWNRRGFWRRVIYREDRAAAHATFNDAIRRRGAHHHEFRVVAADRRVIWVRNRAVVVEDANGTPVLMRCVIMDISAQKSMEIARAEMLERERRITEYLQQPLRTHFAEDAFPDLRVAAWYEPVLDEAEVGGDFHDIFTVGDSSESERTVICVGDVIGKGLPAAELAVRLKRLIHAYAFENPDPADILRRLNNFQYHLAIKETDEDSRMLAGVIIAVVDCEAATVTTAGAGMEPVLIISANGVVREVESEGITVGIQPNEVHQNTVSEVSTGDTILITTDGLTEARLGREFLGFDGLTQIALEHMDAETITDMGNAIVRDARAFGGKFGDDVCFVLVRCRNRSPAT